MTGNRFLVAAIVVLALPWGAAFAQSSPPPSDGVSNPARTLPASPDEVRSPMQEQAMVPNTAPVTETCGGSPPVSIKDEFGREYNCRGDRVR